MSEQPGAVADFVTDRVVDASAMALAVGAKSDTGTVLRNRMAGMRVHAPHLIDAEVANVLRRQERAGTLAPEEAVAARRAAVALVRFRYPHLGRVGDQAWSYRHNLSIYDGLYVGLATLLGITLLTADARLSKAPGLRCAVELV